MTGHDGSGTPKDINERVSQDQLREAIEQGQDKMINTINQAINNAITTAIADLRLPDSLERLDKRISTLDDRVMILETRPPPHNEDDVVYDAYGNKDEAATREAQLRRRLRTNTVGMGGNHNRAPDDPYAKIKFSIPSFSGHYDAEGYLDWEMVVEQKFSAHLVPEQHRVRQATSEFKDFAIIWWTGLTSAGLAPTTWADLKVAMRDRFVPPSYHRDLRKSLMRLEQGDKSVQTYYAELQKGLMRCGKVEGIEDSICRFYSGLQCDIRDIVDYNEFNIVNQLFHLAMFAEKELQGHEQGKSKVDTTYTQRSTTSSGLPKPSSFRAPTPTSR